MDYKSVICDLNNIYECYLKSIKGSKWKEATQKYMMNYLDNLIDLQEELLNETYKPDKEECFILNERGKTRHITSLTPRDRIVRHLICDCVLMPLIKKKVIYDNGASIEKRGLSHARKRFEAHVHKAYMHYGTHELYCLFGDFSKFYDNVKHDVAINQLLELVDYDSYVEWLLTVLFKNFEIDVSNKDYYDEVFNRLEYEKIPKKFLNGSKFMKKSINIGDQISQLVGVYYPNKLDTYIKYVLGIKYYGRYMDDFYIISNSKKELNYVLTKIRPILKELGIYLNNKKTRIVKLNKTNKYLQIKYTLLESGKLIRQINPKRLKSFRHRLKQMSKNTQIEKIDKELSFKSWMCNFYKIMSKKQRIRIINLYEKLFDSKLMFKKYSTKYKIIKEDSNDHKNIRVSSY
jgi:RNA-directed DNA polymerase